MISREVVLLNRLGLHARAAGALVRLASTFRSEITLARDECRANAKSIMGLMMLAAAQGCSLTLTAEGEDESEALAAIEDLFARKFDEE